MSYLSEVQISPSLRPTFIYTTPQFQAALTAGDLAQLYRASGSKNLALLKVLMNYSQYSDVTVHNFQIKKRSTLNGAAAGGSVSGVPVAASMGAGTGSLLYYTANPSKGTDVGAISSLILGVSNSGGLANGGSYGMDNPYTLFDAHLYGAAPIIESGTEAFAVEMIGNISPAAAGVPFFSFTFVTHEFS